MGVVIEICIKYPGGPTRIKGTDMHTCATAKLEGQWTADTKTQGEGGAAVVGRTKLVLYYCRRTQETPGAPEDTRGNQEGHQRDRRAHGGSKRHRQDRRGTGGSERAVRPEGSNIGNFPCCRIFIRAPFPELFPKKPYVAKRGKIPVFCLVVVAPGSRTVRSRTIIGPLFRENHADLNLKYSPSAKKTRRASAPSLAVEGLPYNILDRRGYGTVAVH
jgi:hypothetical protein